MTEQDALAVALAEASPRVVGIRAEAEAILAALPPDAHLFTVESLAAAMGKAWPGHIEGSGSSGTQYTVPPPETKYWVKDSCLPSEHLAAAILKAAKEASE